MRPSIIETLIPKGVVGKQYYYDRYYLVVSKKHSLPVVDKKEPLTNGTHIQGGVVHQHEPFIVDGHFMHLGTKYFFVYEKEVDQAEEVPYNIK
jgi:hypothetical protein